MQKFFKTRKDVVEFVDDHLKNLDEDFVSIITIRPEKLGAFFANIVTIASLDDILMQTSYNVSRTISDKAPDYTFPPSPPRSEEEIVADLRKGFEKSWLLSQTKEKDAGLG